MAFREKADKTRRPRVSLSALLLPLLLNLLPATDYDDDARRSNSEPLASRRALSTAAAQLSPGVAK